MFNENVRRRQAIGDVVEALQRMRLGTVDRTVDDGGRVTFTITMNDERCATRHRLKRMADAVQSMGFRTLRSRIQGPVLGVECVRSRRVSTKVERIAQVNGEWLILTGGGMHSPKMVSVSADTEFGLNEISLTQKDDSIVLWYDHDGDDKASETPTTFGNPSLRAALAKMWPEVE